MEDKFTGTVGFKILDDEGHRTQLERDLRRIGYALGDWEPERRLIRELDVPILPLGRGPTLVLHLEQDADQAWAFGTLQRRDEAGGTVDLAEIDFDPRVRGEKSCYAVWIDQIVASVRLATKPLPDPPATTT